MAAGRFTIADISIYGYVHVIEDIDLSFDDYPHIKKWLDSVAAEPRYITIED